MIKFRYNERKDIGTAACSGQESRSVRYLGFGVVFLALGLLVFLLLSEAKAQTNHCEPCCYKLDEK